MTPLGGGSLDPDPVVRLIRNGKIVNRILTSICGQEDLSRMGVKADLQNRIIERLFRYATNNEVFKFERLKTMIENPSVIPQNGRYLHVISTCPVSLSAKHTANISSTSRSILNPLNFYRTTFNKSISGESSYQATENNQVIQFKSSPYYSMVEQLGATVICDVMATHRHIAKIQVSVNQYRILGQVAQEPNLRVMVFGASEGQGPQDIAFPHQSELKINGGEIKANLRGLKNKPGSTRPVDITDSIRLYPPGYVNNIELNYALTNKKFYLMAFVTRAVSVPNLVKQLAEGQKITEKTVVAEMVSKSRDTDIIATASVLSLKCPLSTLRIDLPCRSISCRHNQCFDATSYLQLQEQGPTWSCPICNNPAPFDSLAVDEYVKNILQKTSKYTDQVTIQPDGKWELNDKKDMLQQNHKTETTCIDDEVVEIIGIGNTARHPVPVEDHEISSIRSQPSFGGISRDISSVTGLTRSNNCKRPLAAVIDLTSSADEDEKPFERPQKRQNTTNTGHATSPQASLPKVNLSGQV